MGYFCNLNFNLCTASATELCNFKCNVSFLSLNE